MEGKLVLLWNPVLRKCSSKMFLRDFFLSLLKSIDSYGRRSIQMVFDSHDWQTNCYFHFWVTSQLLVTATYLLLLAQLYLVFCMQTIHLCTLVPTEKWSVQDCGWFLRKWLFKASLWIWITSSYFDLSGQCYQIWCLTPGPLLILIFCWAFSSQVHKLPVRSSSPQGSNVSEEKKYVFVQRLWGIRVQDAS